MKQLTRLTILLFISVGLALTAAAGPEALPSGKEMKEVAPAPVPVCNWSGFYIGLNVGGQFGHSETNDLDEWNITAHHHFGYDESGVIAGGQVGYNFQWNWLVLGIEADGGYMNLDGRGVEPGSPDGDSRGETDSDFFTTIRGRLGLAFGHWLFYGTGGGIGVNYETRFIDDCAVAPCGGGLIDARKTEFDWGWTGGGGIEYMLGCHWSIRAEYLYFALDNQDFSAVPVGGPPAFHFTGETEGNIIRAALNYKF